MAHRRVEEREQNTVRPKRGASIVGVAICNNVNLKLSMVPDNILSCKATSCAQGDLVSKCRTPNNLFRRLDLHYQGMVTSNPVQVLPVLSLTECRY